MLAIVPLVGAVRAGGLVVSLTMPPGNAAGRRWLSPLFSGIEPIRRRRCISYKDRQSGTGHYRYDYRGDFNVRDNVR